MFGFSVFRSRALPWIALNLVIVGLGQTAPKPTPVKPLAISKASTTPAPVLDTTTIRKLYLDGDFDQAIEILETGLKDKRAYSHDDSVMIFKHLGVMYAAKYETREKGKYYMHQLLTVEPTARILDMYASDMIYMIFKNIQDEFDQAGGRLNRAEGHVNGNSQKGSGSKNLAGKQETKKPANAKAKGNQTIYWVGASTVAVAAGVSAYLLLADQGASDKANHGVE